MNRHDQDPHDWLSAQFSDDDVDDDENAGTDAADADATDASDSVADATEPVDATGTVADPVAASAASDPAASAPAASDPAASAPAASDPAASAPVVPAPEPVRRASSPASTTGAPFTWGLRPSAAPAAPGEEPAEQPATAGRAGMPEREPDPIVPASLAPKAEQPASAQRAPGFGPVSPVSARSTDAPVPAAPATADAPVSPARPFYPPPPAISRPAQPAAEPAAEPDASQPAEPAGTDVSTGSAMSIEEVLDAPSPRRAAREAAAREDAAREAEARDAAATASEHTDGIDDLADPNPPLTPHDPFAPQSAAPDVPGTAEPVRATGMPRFDVPVVPTADGPALAGRAQSVASREATRRAASSRTQRILLIAGIVLVVALTLVLILVLAQRADAAAVADALRDTPGRLAAGLARLL